MWFTVIKMDRTTAGTGKQDSGHILKNFPGLSSAAGCCLPLNPWVLSNFWPRDEPLQVLNQSQRTAGFPGKIQPAVFVAELVWKSCPEMCTQRRAVIDAKPPKPHGGFTL